MVAEQRISPLLVIVGQTASGKSTLALQLAQQLSGEIISADAWSVRRGADIGTAKPSEEDRRLVPHHLIDILGPRDKFSAADFKSLAEQTIKDINSRGKLPIIAGGSGLYVDGLLYGYSFMDTADPQRRRELEKMNLETLLAHARGLAIDTQGIDVRNKRRLIRLIENGGRRPTRSEMRPNTLAIGIDIDKEVLRARIEKRVEDMLAMGLEKEVFELSRDFGWDCEALKGIGYFEWHDYFFGATSIGEVKENIVRDTLGLAKRQKTWFKRNKSIQWLTNPVNMSQLVDIITTKLYS